MGDFIADCETLRIRCKTHEQLGEFPSVLNDSIDSSEIEMIAFPESVKGIKTIVFFIAPYEGNMDILLRRFQSNFDCKVMKAKTSPKENFETILKKRGWTCSNCTFSNLEWWTLASNANRSNLRRKHLQSHPLFARTLISNLGSEI